MLAVMSLCVPGEVADAEDLTVLWPTALFGGVRNIGLGGAFTGLSDDVNATASNPAGLMTLPRSFELGFSAGNVRPGARPMFSGLAFHPNRKFAVGLSYVRVEPHRLGAAINEGDVLAPVLPFVSASTSGASIGYRPLRGVAFGFTARHWLLSGYGGDPRDKSPDLISDGAFGWSAGALFFPGGPEAPRLGLTFQRELDWDVVVAGARRFVRAPSVISAGVSWHYDLFGRTRFLFSGQADLVRYSRVRSLRPAVDARDDLNVGAGLEASHTLGRCFTGCGGMVQVRFGVASRGKQPGGAVLEGRRIVWTAGASLALQQVLTGRLRFESSYRQETDAFIFGLGYRFPESYRADLENHARRH